MSSLVMVVRVQPDVPLGGLSRISPPPAFQVQPFGSSFLAIVNGPPATDPNRPGTLMIVDANNNRTPVLYPCGDAIRTDENRGSKRIPDRAQRERAEHL